MAEAPRLVFHEVVGDIFTCPITSSLGHCLSSDFKMSKGIAVNFREKFGQVEEMQRKRPSVGDIVVLRDGNRFVYNLVTKKRFFDKPTYEALSLALQEMKNHMIRNSVKDLCLPRIGCGLDKLEWPKVKEIIKTIFKHENVQITVYSQ